MGLEYKTFFYTKLGIQKLDKTNNLAFIKNDTKMNFTEFLQEAQTR